MRLTLRVILAVAVVGVAGTRAQIELDRILSRVDGRIVTQSDIRQARTLRLVETVDSDEATLRALENRLLILQELERAAPLEAPDAEALRRRRSEWTAAQGDGQRAEAALRQVGMSEADLDGWLRDDLRIGAYLRRQFGMLGEAERARAVEEWLRRLRQRADLNE